MWIAFFVRRRVVIRDDYDAPSSQRLCIFFPPLSGAHRVARREQAEVFQGVNVLLAFADENGVALALDQFRETIKHKSDILEVPEPSAVAVWPSQLETLGIEANC